MDQDIEEYLRALFGALIPGFLTNVAHLGSTGTRHVITAVVADKSFGTPRAGSAMRKCIQRLFSY